MSSPLPASDFPKSARLLCKKDYTPIFEKAVYRAGHTHFLLLARPSCLKTARLGLVIAKKHVRKATQRNQLKRLIRESFRHRREHLPTIDVIVLARSGADGLSNGEVLSTLNTLWVRLSKQHAKMQSQCD